MALSVSKSIPAIISASLADVYDSIDTVDATNLLPSVVLNNDMPYVAIDVANLGAALTDFAILGQVDKDVSTFHTLISGSSWQTLTGTLIRYIGTFNTLASGSSAHAYLDVGPMYAIKFRASIAAGARNAGTLTLTANPLNTETVTIGSKVYRYVTALAQANDVLMDPDATAATSIFTAAANPTNTKATGTLTLTGQPADTQTCTLNSNTYTFQTALTNVANNVLIGANASDTIDNLIAAITGGAGSGTVYAALTVTHTTCTATAGAGDTMTAEAIVGGTAANSYATTDTADNTSWGATTLSGGTTETVTIGAKTYTFKTTLTTANDIAIAGSASATLDNFVAGINAGAGAGSAYGTGTTANASATAAAGAGDTIDLTAITAGLAGNDIVSTETCAQCSFGDTTFDGATSGLVSDSIDSLIAAINGDAGSGTLYHASTVAHTQVTAAAGAGETMVVTARANITNAVGTLIATTETLTAGSWAATTLADGIASAVTVRCVAHR